MYLIIGGRLEDLRRVLQSIAIPREMMGRESSLQRRELRPNFANSLLKLRQIERAAQMGLPVVGVFNPPVLNEFSRIEIISNCFRFPVVQATVPAVRLGESVAFEACV